MNIKPFDELDITDPIMFGLVFSNKHIAHPFIEHLLGAGIVQSVQCWQQTLSVLQGLPGAE